MFNTNWRPSSFSRLFEGNTIYLDLDKQLFWLADSCLTDSHYFQARRSSEDKNKLRVDWGEEEEEPKAFTSVKGKRNFIWLSVVIGAVFS